MALEKELAACTEKKNTAQNELNDVISQINRNENEQRDLEDSVASGPADIARIDGQIPIVDRKIASLKQQLDDAEQ